MDILIIRSTSLEHFDLVLKRVREVFPETNIHILTHSHAVKSLEGDRISVIPYEERKDFSIFKIISLQDKKIFKQGFDLVVVPFNNESGLGYLNVILLAFGIKAKKRISCNINGKLKRIGYGYLTKRLFVAILSSLFALVSTVIFAPPLLLFIYNLGRKDHRGKENNPF